MLQRFFFIGSFTGLQLLRDLRILIVADCGAVEEIAHQRISSYKHGHYQNDVDKGAHEAADFAACKN